MVEPLERRKVWSRIVGVERRAAPLREIEGRPLPDPTRLEDEEFIEAQRQAEEAREKAATHWDRWDRSGRS